MYFQPKFQFPRENSFVTRNLLEVIATILDEKMYDQLRTQKQLGYYVGVGKKETVGVYGISFIIQSAEYDPDYL